MTTAPRCTRCHLPATVLVSDVPFCTADGRVASGGRL